VTPLRQRTLEDLQIRHYSPTTIRIYLRHRRVRATLPEAPDQLGAEHIGQYQLFLMREKQASLSSYIQMVCALRIGRVGLGVSLTIHVRHRRLYDPGVSRRHIDH
jgi:integrase/recombinase XerD